MEQASRIPQLLTGMAGKGTSGKKKVGRVVWITAERSIASISIHLGSSKKYKLDINLYTHTSSSIPA